MAEKADGLSSDAVPFDYPKDEDQTYPKTPASEEKKEDPKKEAPKKKQPKKKPKKKSESDSSDSDDGNIDSRSRQRSKRQQKCSIISIKNANNLHIGNKYNFSKVNTEIRQVTIQKNVATQGSADAAACNKTSQAPLSKELSESTREITTVDIYEVAENISLNWKKLARFLPPRNVFTDGELSTLQQNNPNDLVEAIVQMLTTWQTRHPTLFTIGNLAKTLHLIERADIANKLKP